MEAGSPLPTGSLLFDAQFESGNVGPVARVNSLEWDVGIRADTLNPRFRVWYYFRVSNMALGQKVVLNMCNFSKTKSLYRDGMTPCVRSASRPHWERLPDKHVYYYRAPRHGNEYVLSFAFQFDLVEPFYFAYSFPYTYSNLQQILHRIDALNLPHYRRECLAYTLERRRLDLITISSPENLARDALEQQAPAGGGRTASSDAAPGASGPEAGRSMASASSSGGGGAQATARTSRVPVVFVTARVHPGESPSSFMMHGLLTFLLSAEPQAVRLRSLCVLKLVPMLCPDGVALGNYRCCSLGIDLNRHWQNPSAWAAPTVSAVKRLMERYASSPHWAPTICLDMHAHSTATSGFLFCNSEVDPGAFERAAAFPRALAAVARDFSFTASKFCADPAKAGTGRRALSDLLAGAHCYALEVSFFAGAAAASASAAGAGGGGAVHGGGSARGSSGGAGGGMCGGICTGSGGAGSGSGLVPYSQKGYAELGRKIGLALHDHHLALTVARQAMAPRYPLAALLADGSRPAPESEATGSRETAAASFPEASIAHRRSSLCSAATHARPSSAVVRQHSFPSSAKRSAGGTVGMVAPRLSRGSLHAFAARPPVGSEPKLQSVTAAGLDVALLSAQARRRRTMPLCSEL